MCAVQESSLCLVPHEIVCARGAVCSISLRCFLKFFRACSTMGSFKLDNLETSSDDEFHSEYACRFFPSEDGLYEWGLCSWVTSDTSETVNFDRKVF